MTKSPSTAVQPGSSGAAPPVGTVHRSVELLRTLAEADGEASLSSLATQLNLPRSTVHRLLQLFLQEGLVAVAPGSRQYEIGPELYRIAALVLRRRDVAAMAEPIMKDVVAETSETCLLGLYLPTTAQMTFAAEAPSSHPLGYRIDLDRPMPVVWGASGRAILAWRSEEEIDAILSSRHEPSASGAPFDPKSVRTDLARVRERGYAATSAEKIAGSHGVAAPLFDGGEFAIGSLCVTIPAFRAGRGVGAAIGPLLVDRAQKLSRLLGSRGRPN
jgi:DNA-binding IclR family transcriptional regulator